MYGRLGWIATVAATLSLSGCSSRAAAPATTAAKASSQASSSSAAPGEEAAAPLDSESSEAVTGAILDLSAATRKDEAGTGGLQIDDPT